MSKLNQIQTRLRQLDGGTFQKLADAYLRKRGYERINPLGSVPGSDKVRTGTPDSLIALPNGKYVFAEYTTEKGRVFDKIRSDIEKCLNPHATGVPTQRIEEIVICHTSTLDASKELELAAMCRDEGVNLNLFGLGPLSFDLYQKYPNLARDFLAVEVDTGQVLSPEDFVATYNKGTLALPLDTVFHFREREVGLLLDHLVGAGNLVVVAGPPGNGKTRFALKCCARFQASQPEYEFKCIFNRGPDLFQDLRDHFSENKNYLILVDDANRVSGFEYVLQLLQQTGEGRRIKIVATVRSYAREQIHESARNYGGAYEIELQSLSDEEIATLIEEEFGITNHLYLDRIAKVAQGNPRIAVMAAIVAKRENTLASLVDVSALYDEYYKSIRSDFQDIGNRDLLKVAGILTFFRVLDRSHVQSMREVSAVFGISSEALWEGVRRLHDLEAVDLYEDEVARISDQVLATYLFYLAFFEERVLNFSLILEHFFPDYSHRLVDALNPVVNAFDTRKVAERLRSHVDAAWRKREAAGDEEGMMHLLQHFWFIKQTDTLVYIRDQVAKMGAEPIDDVALDAQPDSDIPSPSLLSVLGQFCQAEPESMRVAISMVCDLLAKRPREFPRVRYLLQDRYGFRHTSHLQAFYVQRAVIDLLWARTQDGSDPLFTRLFVAIAESFLKTNFNASEMQDARTWTIYTFDLPNAPELISLRRIIWRGLFRVCQSPDFSDWAIQVFSRYHPFGQHGSVKEIVATDAAEVLPFFLREFDPTLFLHCRVVQNFLDVLEFHRAPIGTEHRKRFTNSHYAIYELFLEHWPSRRALELECNEFEALKARRIDDFCRALDLPGYERFLAQCEEIAADLDNDMHRYQFRSGIAQALLQLADRDESLFASVLEAYLRQGNRLNFGSPLSVMISVKLVNVSGAQRARDILDASRGVSRCSWLFGYHIALTPVEIHRQGFDELCALFNEAAPVDLPPQLDFLLKYQVLLDGRAVSRVTRIVLERAKHEPRFATVLSLLFNPNTEINKALPAFVAHEQDLFEQTYFAVLKVDPHADFNRASLGVFLDYDPTFVVRYLESLETRRQKGGLYSEHIEHGPLWLRDNYLIVVEYAITFLYERRSSHFWSDQVLRAIFLREDRGELNHIIIERQDQLLEDLVVRRHSDKDFMEFLFGLISSFVPERRRRFISLFIQNNRSVEAFRDLPVEETSWSWSGSMVSLQSG